MLFNSFTFLLVFLPLVVAGTSLAGSPTLRIGFWLIASYVFYAVAGLRFVPVLLWSTLIGFLFARAIHQSDRWAARKPLLVMAIILTLAPLVVFKYAAFVAENILTVSAAAHRAFGWPMLALPHLDDLGPPVGISFFTFMIIGYTVDVYRRQIEPEKNVWSFACFVALFPHLIAGPVLRAQDILPQIERPTLDRQARLDGLLLLAMGLVKKVLIADRIAPHVDAILGDIGSASTEGAWLAMIGYTLQIYFDFSGYTDMARGIARMLGIEMPINFDAPYRALNPREFWRRWHISLSTWLRDFVYIPLGGSQGTASRTARNLLLTMLIGGLWHGASWTFVVWGALHGMALVVYRRFQAPWDALPAAVRWVGMFTFIVLSWVPFRLPSLGDVAACYRIMFWPAGTGTPGRLLVVYVVIAAFFALVGRNTNELRWPLLRPWAALILGVLTFYAMMHLESSREFLYFRF